MTQVLQDAMASTPTGLELRPCVLEQDLNIERVRGDLQQFRSEVQQEFARVHAALAAIRETLAQIQGTLHLHDLRITHTTRLAWAMVGLAVAMVVVAVVLR